MRLSWLESWILHVNLSWPDLIQYVIILTYIFKKYIILKFYLVKLYIYIYIYIVKIISRFPYKDNRIITNFFFFLLLENMLMMFEYFLFNFLKKLIQSLSYHSMVNNLLL